MTGVNTLSEWFTDGLTGQGLAICNGAKPDFMLVVCDTFSNEDYPVYATTETFWDEHDRLHEQNMQRVIEVYDLHANVNQQMQERRAWHPPERKASDVSPEPRPATNYLAQAQAADEAVDRLNATAPLVGRLPGSGEIDMGVTIEMLASVCERFIERELDVDLNDGERMTLREYLVFGGPMEPDPNEVVVDPGLCCSATHPHQMPEETGFLGLEAETGSYHWVKGIGDVRPARLQVVREEQP